MAALYEQHAAMVLAICRRLLRDETEAEDAAQQTFLSAQRALRNGSRPREPAAWLATIARNECVARTRARKREPPPSDAEPSAAGPDTHAEAVRRESVESLRAAIGSLPEQQREAILLRELRGLSYEEVAASLALSPSAVESLLFRARKGLRLRMRSARAALSPVGWLATVRELSTQVAAGGGPGVGPAATKAVAIGLGTAVIAGGALVGPGALHPARHHPPRSPAAPKAAPATRHAAVATSPTSEARSTTPAPPAPVAQPAPRTPAVAAIWRPPRIVRVPTAARSSGDDRPVRASRSTRTTEREGASPNLGGERSRPAGSEAAGGRARPALDATSRSGPAATRTRTGESESPDSPHRRPGGAGDRENAADD